ncbi:MAG: hypothetical protein QM758_26280 [Armatimonas sp.]
MLHQRKVEIVATDGFLLPTAELERRGILHRKGFPDSYDAPKLMAFLEAIRAGNPTIAPKYSHILYDPLPDEQGQPIEAPDLVILEGVNTLQPEFLPYYDRTLYLHADEADLHRWYTDRVQRVREAVRDQPDAFLHYLAQLSDDEFTARINRVWEEVNLKNLREHILPTKPYADLIAVKGPDHELVNLIDQQQH